ncbi:ATISA1/ISA1 [Arabidopsis lyrata subsp. lyrata]|uniref:isoamylase n=1 Tax=Arabidopsis lyrata subsp. lyrata TaxID=81972 RepID=D7LDU2_ARALL|nr:isoamylase 1, chloroplastic [Arabidopsis lyrata subsp. lyrata]EFH56092.1 ATISA1/ISA1 [Arabidopsis lyrata subsp. lyrata]|eukprot:XP_002879833.1 isoamylase 1, chloroplastic [Arabidopsis lyrata subsp. lyrata]
MDSIKCSSSFLHRTKLNILFSNHAFPKISAPNFKRLFRPISISAKARRSSEAESIAVVEKPLKSERFNVSNGLPSPFGATVRDDGVNFSVYSTNSVSATICLISLSDLRQNKVTEEIQLDPSRNRTGHVWHVFLKGDFKDMLYGYRFDGKFSPEEGHYYDSSNILLDPYAKAIISRDEFGVLGPDENCWPQMASMVPTRDEEFDWEGDMHLKLPQKDLVIYEMHVRGFTRHESSKIEFPGTYQGVAEKLDHLKELGINCIELMPCHEFNELEYYSYNTILGDHRLNFWGYSTIGFFSPMIRYASASSNSFAGRAINEFKILVKEAHKRGIEVIMDVVLNHTAEGNEKGPIFSFRGVDNSVYYMLAPKGEFYNYSGCGNTFNCNHPVVRQFIVDCLRYWVTEMHVDGFRFDLGSIMSRSSSLWDAANVYGVDVEGDLLTTGTPISCPPVIDMISNDPILRGVKLIAEAWDAGGLYQVGMFPHWGIWSEWNGKFRDVVRQFIKGTDGFSGVFAECLCGSPNLYQGGRKPWNSINFICAHDGFTLADLVTYNNKNNLANGEENNDGENHNYSWNCGEEGDFASISVKRLRKRQMRNFFVSLMVSQGVPMIYMGDEYGHTKGGNNNTYCHDNYMNYFRWDKKEEAHSDFFRFCRLLIKFRDECESLGLNDFPTAKRLQWHGLAPEIPNWSETSRFVAFSLVDSVKREIYVAFNTSHLATLVCLPNRPGYRWEPFVDTSKPSPYDCITPDLPERETAMKQYRHFLDANMYPMLSYSSIILLLSPIEDT